MPKRRLKNVWAAPCPRCQAEVNSPCIDQRQGSYKRELFGRRTHSERVKKVREMASVKAGSITIPIQKSTVVWNDWVTENNYLSSRTFHYAPTPITYSTTTLTTQAWYDAQTMQTWHRWTNATGTITTSAISDAELATNTWNTWQRYEVTYGGNRQVHQLTAEDLAQRERERASRRALQEAQRLKRVEDQLVAHSRALDLLEMILTPDQRQERIEDQRITVRGPSGRTYRVETHRETVHGNVVEIDEHGCSLGRLCVAPGMYSDGGALPTADGWVGQVLAIQHNEEEFLAKANWSQRRACQQPGVPILGQRAA